MVASPQDGQGPLRNGVTLITESIPWVGEESEGKDIRVCGGNGRLDGVSLCRVLS